MELGGGSVSVDSGGDSGCGVGGNVGRSVAARWAGGPHLSLSGGGRRTGRTTDHRLAPLLRVLMPSRTSA